MLTCPAGFGVSLADYAGWYPCHHQSCRYVPSETIVLDNVNLVADAPDRAVAHGYEGHCCFSVTTPKRTFYMLTKSKAERDDWIAAIELNVFLRYWNREHGLLSLDYVKQPPQEGRRAAVSSVVGTHTRVLPALCIT